MDQVRSAEVGQSTQNIYVSYIDYMFEGKNFLQVGYQKTTDPDYRDVSHKHGAKSNIEPSRYNLRDS